MRYLKSSATKCALSVYLCYSDPGWKLHIRLKWRSPVAMIIYVDENENEREKKNIESTQSLIFAQRFANNVINFNAKFSKIPFSPEKLILLKEM